MVVTNLNENYETEETMFGVCKSVISHISLIKFYFLI